MDIKTFLTILSLISCSNGAGMLRRTPKVYNALITTDDNLTPSRAFPVIQPTIHETGIAHYPYGPYNPYKLYHPSVVHLGAPTFESRQYPNFVQQHHSGPLSPYDNPPPSAPGSYFAQNVPYETNHLGLPLQPLHPQANPEQMPHLPPQGPHPHHGIPNYFHQQPHAPMQPPHGPMQPPHVPIQPQHPPPSQPQPPQNNANDSEVEQKADQPAKAEGKQNPENPQQPSIPLNEYGLPPSLIPLHQYQPHPQVPTAPGHGPIPLQPYPFNTYPLIYDQYNHYIPGHDHYLPPYGYYPPHSYGIPIHRPGKNRPKNPSPTEHVPTSTPKTDDTTNLEYLDSNETTPEIPLEAQLSMNKPGDNIKNGIENKDKNIPDVPPPPLPAGAKKSQNVLAL